MIVNVSYKNGNFYDTYEDVQCINSSPKYHILHIERFGKEDIKIFDTDIFILETEEMPDFSPSRVPKILADIRRLVKPDTEVYIFGIDGVNADCGDVFRIYNGLFGDIPDNVLDLPVDGVYPSSKGVLDIYVMAICLNDDLIIKKEGVEQYAENNSNNEKP